MAGKILILGECLEEVKRAGVLGGYPVLACSSWAEAASQLQTHSDIQLIVLCREQRDQDSFDLVRQLEAAQPGRKIPIVIAYDEEGLLQVLTSASPHHAGLLHAIFNQSSLGIAVGLALEPGEYGGGLYPMVNDAFLKITGHTRGELVELGWEQIVHPQDALVAREQRQLLEKGAISSYSLEQRLLRPDGTEVWVELTAAPFEQPGVERPRIIYMIKDISDRKAVEGRLSESERSKAVLLKNLPGLAYRCLVDRDWTMQFVSEGCEELTGYTAESLLYNRDLSFNDLIAPEYREVLWQKWHEVLPERRSFEFEYEIITASGERKWVLEMGQGVYNDAGEVEALEGIIIDITQRKESELQLKRISELDLLTGLPNRRALRAVMAADSESGRYPKRAVVLFNLRRINTINAIYGFGFCEFLLRAVAQRLAAHTTATRRLYLAAYGRFAFYIQEALTREELIQFCTEVVETLKEIDIVNTYGCGIGIRQLEGEVLEPEDCIHDAAIAAQRADRSRPFAYRFFDQDLAAELNRLSEIEELLFRVAYGEWEEALFLEYQPIIDAATGRIYAFEALARLDGGPLGVIPPGEFIPLAEENQLIVPLGKIIARKALGFLRSLAELGYRGFRISINVSAIQLAQDGFEEEVFALIEEAGIQPEQLCLEITESVFAQNYASLNEKLARFRQAGIVVAIDDFGTGYSSLAREQELNVNCLKIHKAFIDRVTEVSEDQVIAGDIISMAHRLGHLVVAEGVEQEAQKEYLVKHGCDFLQGFLFSRPVGEAEAVALLARLNR
ncbi:putative bifunctional diguanylate cyclase/phosphodiesterase [Candidatus Darwinibacter acetoxidans]